MSCENEVSQQPVTDDALIRIRGEYLEMPGLRLTTRQAQRLWHFDHARCEVPPQRACRYSIPPAHSRRSIHPVWREVSGGHAHGCDGATVSTGGGRCGI